VVLRPTDLWQRIDRRRAERVVVDLNVTRARRYPSSGGSLLIEFSVRDLSVAGLLIELDQRLGLGDLLEFGLPLDDAQDPPEVRVRVQRLQQAGDDEPRLWLAGCGSKAYVPTI
jgi:hypothetical protein